MHDNLILKVSGSNVNRLTTTLSLANYTKATGYSIDKEAGFVLYWAETEKAISFPIPLDMQTCANIIDKWLDDADYPKEPDIDGDTEKGWLVYTDGWGQITSKGWESFAAIKPYWVLYGK